VSSSGGSSGFLWLGVQVSVEVVVMDVLRDGLSVSGISLDAESAVGNVLGTDFRSVSEEYIFAVFPL
jgi:hypothetical protein